MEPVQKAIWYVESHSREPASLEEIAAACHVSSFHLTRAFASVTGLSLMRYVRARRLSEAARQLAGGASDILRLALDSGYSSHEAFTRAFRDQFGCTPEQVRTLGLINNIPLMEALPMTTTSVTELESPRFEMLKAMQFAGLLERYNCESPAGIPNQWQRFLTYRGAISGQVSETAYGVCYNFDKADNFDYLCSVEITGTPELPLGFTTLKVPAHKYAVFAHRGHIAGIRSVCSAIWSTWFPNSGCKAANAPMLERYGEEFDPSTGLGGFEIWIPIEE